MISDLAWHYFDFLRRLVPQADESVWLTGVLVVQASLEGHACLDLVEIGGQPISTNIDESGPGAAIHGVRLPNSTTLKDNLLKSGAVGNPGDQSPFILDDYRLYLQRYWQYENYLATELTRRAVDYIANPDLKKISGHLANLFPIHDDTGPDWQRMAAAVCALKGLCVISGGPGTGKTFTVARIIALLQLLSAPYSLRVALAAPTGKAASRLAESIQEARESLDLAETTHTNQPNVAITIHRLLGVIPHSPYFRHNLNNKLDIDVLIVDEVSMVDLALMAKLLAAVPERARIILLGDKDQLASVEAGRVMGDICGKIKANCFSKNFAGILSKTGGILDQLPIMASQDAIADCVVLLTKSYRFNQDSGIGKLATAIIAGKAKKAVDCLKNSSQLQALPAVDLEAQHSEQTRYLSRRISQGYGPLFSCHDPAGAFDVFEDFQVLCVHREDETGVERLNRWITTIFRSKGLMSHPGNWYHGRPIMITGNHYGLGLFNGDIGITLATADQGLRVYFKQGDNIRAISCARIPEHETAFAITVHKSQGSEFNTVMLILPGRESSVLSRELIYTAVTRAKKYFEIWGDDEILIQGILKQVKRSTGLAKRLRIL